ncbi:MAG TPA: DciA family protein [Gammaproteobacteria bacterium]|nr:DciA family protein [Gammaproteobacteria bacterium]
MREPTTPDSIGKLLNTEHSALQRIVAKVQQLKQINEVFTACLDSKLKSRCVVGNIYADKLVVIAENAAFATQFRFYIPELLPQLRQKHPLLRGLKTIECKLNSLGK